MIAPARLLSVRLQGFKSFAERTHVTFGPGISAVVGPNGSGKSNLADALRWALGEQGRALRTRKSEDVIWAGSDRRSAVGMADVELALDNADGLLPVDFAVVELGRRLYRSGENEYRLNRERARLRDLVDLLEAAHLAENAFLFIGQGMVDQALALRPEERRPLFEEVAGVRRHERRRRRAEEQLAESEVNAARIEDILAELRPQARRLGAQAEQQATRESAGEALAAALLASAGARWHEAAARLRDADRRVTEGRRATDAALAELGAAEESISVVGGALASRVERGLRARAEHDAALAALTERRLQDARLAADLDAMTRDRQRLDAERTAVELEVAEARRVLAVTPPERDTAFDGALAEVDGALAEALAELSGVRGARPAIGESLAAARRADAVRAAEAETARRRLADAERRSSAEESRLRDVEARTSEAEAVNAGARSGLERAMAAEAGAAGAVEDARAAAEIAEASRATTAARLAEVGSALAARRSSAAIARAAITADGAGRLASAARRLGGVPLEEGIEVEPELRAAVAAALGDQVRAVRLRRAAVAEVAGADIALDRGIAVVDEAIATLDPTAAAADGAIVAAVGELGGGRLVDAVRRDPSGAVRALLGRALWLPDLASCLGFQDRLRPGWIAVPRDGSAVVTPLTVILGRTAGRLERRADLVRLDADVERLAAEEARARGEADRARSAADAARAAHEAARRDATRTASERRVAEDAERRAARVLESAARELAWGTAQVERLRAEVRQLAAETAASPGAPSPEARPDDAGAAAAIATWEARVGELRARRDRFAVEGAGRDAQRAAAEAARARAEAAVVLAEARGARAAREEDALAQRLSTALAERAELAVSVAAAIESERLARASLDALASADGADRERLATAEAAAASARDRLRIADEHARAAERMELEARLGLEALREGVVVELVGLGEVGLRGLRAAGGLATPVVAAHDEPWSDAEDDVAEFESALAAAARRWEAAPPDVEPPSAARLAALRRRLHELGAANPYAVEEYRELRERLESLAGQHRDLVDAIRRTRELIAELDGLIATQFRDTFRALESAFDGRFRQLFGGGFARLSLTDPSDLAATGVEIVARPPGKKAQALAMLSGGERALTAVALLFAMLEVRPVPFCVLDEVDAALDEANIGRFTAALRELAAGTQFIVITHNRGTIETADALYGVTVGDDSVSRLISLRLEDARAIAAEHVETAVAVVAG